MSDLRTPSEAKMNDETLILLCKDIAAAVGRGETGLDLIRLATVAAFERAAQVADDEPRHWDEYSDAVRAAKDIARAIRARGRAERGEGGT